MDKISGILPEKPRLKIDSETMTPVRPGSPTFGRAEGSSEIRDRVSLSTTKNIAPQEFQNYRNNKEAQNVKIVEDLNRKFFMSQAKEMAPAVVNDSKNSEVVVAIPPVDRKFGTASSKLKELSPELEGENEVVQNYMKPELERVNSLDNYA